MTSMARSRTKSRLGKKRLPKQSSYRSRSEHVRLRVLERHDDWSVCFHFDNLLRDISPAGRARVGMTLEAVFAGRHAAEFICPVSFHFRAAAPSAHTGAF